MSHTVVNTPATKGALGFEPLKVAVELLQSAFTLCFVFAECLSSIPIPHKCLPVAWKRRRLLYALTPCVVRVSYSSIMKFFSSDRRDVFIAVSLAQLACGTPSP